MPPDLAEAVRKAKVADALTNGEDTDSGDSSQDTETQTDAETTPQEEPAPTPPEETVPAQVRADSAATPNPNAQSLSDYPADKPSPVPAPTPAQPPQEPEAQRDYAAQFRAQRDQYAQAGDVQQPVTTTPPAAESAQAAAQIPVAMASRELPAPGQPAPDQLTQVERAQLVNAPTAVQPAPDQLTQVERGELVKLPAGQPAPDQLSQVERAQLVKLPAGQPAPDQLSQVERGQLVKVPPGTAPRAIGVAAPVRAPPAAAPPVAQGPINPNAQSLNDYQVGQVGPVAPRALPPGAALPIQRAQPVAGPEPAITEQAQSYTPYSGQRPIQGVILHSADGSSVASDLNTLTGGDPNHQASAHYYVERDGTIHHLVADNDIAWHAGQTKGPYASYNNARTIGIETQHIDGRQNWPDAQIQGEAQVVAGIMSRNPGMTIKDVLGHSDIAPERKQDPLDFPWEKFRGYVQQYLGQQPAAGAVAAAPGAPIAQPATKLSTGFYQNENPKSFVTGRATTFATPQDLASGQDNGVGAPRLGGLDTTQAAGVAIPTWVLQSQLGNNPAAWRQARVDVVDPQTGKRLRVPIVDLGPTADQENAGVVVDMTPTVSKFFGGDKNLSVKLVPKAGPDVMKNPQSWADEQAAIREGFDSSTLQAGAVKVQPQLNYRTVPIDLAEHARLMQQDVANQQGQRSMIMQTPEAQSGNVIGLYNRLDSPVDGVSDGIRQNTQAALKPQIIAMMRAKFPEIKTDQEAWDKAQSNVGALDVGREWFTKALGYAQQFTSVMQKGVAGTDQLHVSQYLDQAMPNASDADKHAYLSKLYAMPVDQRIAEVQSHLPQPQAGIPSTDPQQIVSALDRLSDPNFQKQQATDLANAKAEMERNVSSDPRLRGTFMEKVVDATAQMPAYIAAFSNPVMAPAAMAQVSDQVREAYRQEHPGWDEKTLSEKAGYATLVQFFGQEIANRVMLKGFGPVVGGIENKAQRAIAQAVFGTGSQAAIAAGTQAATNIIAGDEPGKGVAQAATTGAIQGGVTGLVHGVGELARPAPEIVPRRTIEEQPPVQEEQPPVREEPPPIPPVEEQIHPPVQEQQRVVTPPAEQLVQGQLTLPPGYWKGNPQGKARFDALSDDEQQRYIQHLQSFDPSARPSPQVPVTQEDVARRAYEISQERQQAGQSGDQLTDWHQAQQELSQATEPVIPPTQGESEPWVSAIANRFTQERTAAGTLGEVAPGEGASTEALLAKGLQMSPEQVNQHVSDVMNNARGDPVLQAAAIRAEEARLSQQSNALSRASEVNPSDAQARLAADNAFKDLTDFHNGPVAKLKNNWHAQGMSLQGELPVDLSTYNGLREAFLRDVGKPPPAEMEPMLRKTAKAVSDAATADKIAMDNLGKEIEKQSAKRKLPTADQVRQNIIERMKVEPCVT